MLGPIFPQPLFTQLDTLNSTHNFWDGVYCALLCSCYYPYWHSRYWFLCSTSGLTLFIDCLISLFMFKHPPPPHAAQGNHNRHSFIVEPCRSELHCTSAGAFEINVVFLSCPIIQPLPTSSTPALRDKVLAFWLLREPYKRIVVRWSSWWYACSAGSWKAFMTWHRMRHRHDINERKGAVKLYFI